MRFAICVLAIAAFSAGAAVAADAPPAGDISQGGNAARAPRILYICDATPAVKRAFARQFGVAEYVKAADVKAKGDWTAPKCITPSEARRLKLTSAR